MKRRSEQESVKVESSFYPVGILEISTDDDAVELIPERDGVKNIPESRH